MSASESKLERLSSSKVEHRSSSLGTSAAAKLIELSSALAAAEWMASMPGLCSHCGAPRDPLRSKAQFRNVFCSKECEQAFVRASLAFLAAGDRSRMHRRLDTLLRAAQEAAAFEG
jgi:hypothetical protein